MKVDRAHKVGTHEGGGLFCHGWLVGRVGGCPTNFKKAISASIEVEVEWSGVKLGKTNQNILNHPHKRFNTLIFQKHLTPCISSNKGKSHIFFGEHTDFL